MKNPNPKISSSFKRQPSPQNYNSVKNQTENLPLQYSSNNPGSSNLLILSQNIVFDDDLDSMCDKIINIDDYNSSRLGKKE